MIVQRLRTAGFIGTGRIAGFIWPAFLFVLFVGVTLRLWVALGWPPWILIVGVVLFFVRLPMLFPLMVCVAFVAGLFAGEWRWALAIPGVMLLSVVGTILLGLIMTALSGSDDKPAAS